MKMVIILGLLAIIGLVKTVPAVSLSTQENEDVRLHATEELHDPTGRYCGTYAIEQRKGGDSFWNMSFWFDQPLRALDLYREENISTTHVTNRCKPGGKTINTSWYNDNTSKWVYSERTECIVEYYNVTTFSPQWVYRTSMIQTTGLSAKSQYNVYNIPTRTDWLQRFKLCFTPATSSGKYDIFAWKGDQTAPSKSLRYDPEWNNNYTYKKQVNLTWNSSQTNPPNHTNTTKVWINLSELCQGECQADWDDIRVVITNASGSNVTVNYSLEDHDTNRATGASSTNLTFYATTNHSDSNFSWLPIYIHYGNAEATADQAPYINYENFYNLRYDWDYKAECAELPNSESPGIWLAEDSAEIMTTINSSSWCDVNDSDASGNSGYWYLNNSNVSLDNTTTIELRVRWNKSSGNDQVGSYVRHDEADDGQADARLSSDGDIRYFDSGGTTQEADEITANWNHWRTVRIEWFADNTYRYYIDGFLIYDDTQYNAGNQNQLFWGALGDDGTGQTGYDYVRVDLDQNIHTGHTHPTISLGTQETVIEEPGNITNVTAGIRIKTIDDILNNNASIILFGQWIYPFNTSFTGLGHQNYTFDAVYSDQYCSATTCTDADTVVSASTPSYMNIKTLTTGDGTSGKVNPFDEDNGGTFNNTLLTGFTYNSSTGTFQYTGTGGIFALEFNFLNNVSGFGLSGMNITIETDVQGIISRSDWFTNSNYRAVSTSTLANLSTGENITFYYTSTLGGLSAKDGTQASIYQIN